MSEVNVVTSVSAWPEAVPLMKRLLMRFMKESFKLHVFVDTPVKPGPYNLWDPKLRPRVIDVITRETDHVFEVPEILHKKRQIQFPDTTEKRRNNANTRASDTLQYAWNQVIKDSDKPVLLIDNDMFPTNHFSVDSILETGPIAAVKGVSTSKSSSLTIPWIWSGLLFLNPRDLPYKHKWSFDCGKVRGVPVDVSGQTNMWLEEYSKIGGHVNWLHHLPSLTWNSRDYELSLPQKLVDFLVNDDRNQGDMFFAELYQFDFLHFRAGSNWRREPAPRVLARNHAFIEALMTLCEA